MGSEFLEKKLLFVFDKVLDVNGSGTIDKTDFDIVSDNICKIRGWAPGEPKYAETKASFLKIWDELRFNADTDKDEQVSRLEWVGLWKDRKDKWQDSYMKFMFQLQDASGDGRIDIQEFASLCSTFGTDAEESQRAFNAFSNNGELNVDMEYYSKLWEEYFFSHSADAPGNHIFGKMSF